MRKLSLSLFAAGLSAFLIGCDGRANKNTGTMETGTNAPTEALKAQLRSVQGKGILFGQHDALSYGIGWNATRDNVYDRSDIRTVAGSHPAIFSWDLGHIDDKMNLDSVPFDSIRSFIIHAYKMGGINTISWHERNPVTNDNSWTKPDSSSMVFNFIPGGTKVELFNQKLDKVATFLPYSVPGTRWTVLGSGGEATTAHTTNTKPFIVTPSPILGAKEWTISW